MTDQERIELRDLIKALPKGEERAVWKEDIRSLNELRKSNEEISAHNKQGKALSEEPLTPREVLHGA